MKRLVIATAILMGLAIAGPAPSYAYNFLRGTDCTTSGNGSGGAPSESAVCSSKYNPNDPTGNPISGTNGVIVRAANIVAFIAGVAAVIVLVIGGIRYITSGGDANNVKKAKETVFYALIGVAVIVLARTLILYVIDKVK